MWSLIDFLKSLSIFLFGDWLFFVERSVLLPGSRLLRQLTQSSVSGRLPVTPNFFGFSLIFFLNWFCSSYIGLLGETGSVLTIYLYDFCSSSFRSVSTLWLFNFGGILTCSFWRVESRSFLLGIIVLISSLIDSDFSAMILRSVWIIGGSSMPYLLFLTLKSYERLLILISDGKGPR